MKRLPERKKQKTTAFGDHDIMLFRMCPANSIKILQINGDPLPCLGLRGRLGLSTITTLRKFS